MNQFYRNLALWLVIGLILIGLFNVFNKPITPQTEIIYSEFLELANKGQITEEVIQGKSQPIRLYDQDKEMKSA